MKCWDKIKSWFGCCGTDKTKDEEPVAKVAPPSEPEETESTDTPE